MTEKIVTTGSAAATAALFGAFDENMGCIERAFHVRITNTTAQTPGGDAVSVSGERAEDVERAVRALEYLKRMTADGETLAMQSVEYVISLVRDGQDSDAVGYASDTVCLTNRGKPIRPRTVGQQQYVSCIQKNAITLGLGPAGTGKTFLAVAMAVEALRARTVSRIVLTRPAVEAGERLGFLPGDLQSK